MEMLAAEETCAYAMKPCRILVQTKTHLVQGDGYNERCKRIKNIICQHFWKHDFDPDQERFYARADFGYPNRRCFFLVDHGQSDIDEVPIRWYKWTGTSFDGIEKPLPIKVQAILKQYPFAKCQRPRIPTKPAPIDADTRRQMIKARLRSQMTIPTSDLKFLKDHPDEMAWFQHSVHPTLWNSLKLMVDKLQVDVGDAGK